MSIKDKILEDLIIDNPNRKILFEQYKLFVEMANEVSNRRDKTNKFYLTLISLFITVLSIITTITHELLIFFIPLLSIILLSYIRMKNIESYSTLNHGKFDVINKIEDQLPAKVFTMEWDLLELYGYKDLTKIEKEIPKLIIFISILILIILLILFIQKRGYIF